ncbi:IclR family transcriptional regulator [Advenella sp. S44]|nr:helix-turn-helix domain-containing protein [Advenella sp. S44]PJX28240.1 IclR family transcriptional regulator [Advenella sp. S44]
MDIKQQAGAQSIRRALSLLRLIAQHNEQGLTLSELTAMSGLERSTAHRLLNCLLEENFARRETGGKRFQLGIDAMQMGFSTMHHLPVIEELRPLAMKLSRLSEDTVFLVIEQGDYVLCLLREHGAFPVRIFTIGVGEKRLLGIGAGGLALLATHTDAEIEVIYKRHQDTYRKAAMSLPKLLEKCHLTRRNGYASIESTITPGIAGVGFAFSVSAITQVAFSFGAISPRLTGQRRAQMGRLLMDECSAWQVHGYPGRNQIQPIG